MDIKQDIDAMNCIKNDNNVIKEMERERGG